MTTVDSTGPRGDGEVLGERYELGEVLGSGGSARVRRARDTVLDRPVAIKMLRDTVDDADRQRFVNEARTLARLSHPNLVTLLDAGITEERPYIILELVEGHTLADALRNGPLAPGDAADVGEQLARALAYAHEMGVVHRDIKPANVLVDQEHRVKLADFGIARLLGETMRHTKTGTTVGTAAYLAPEQVQGLPVDGSSDVYALGLVLLESLTGERAYPGSPTEAAMARLHRSPDIPGGLPAPWPDLLARMVHLDPTRRPSAASVADELALVAAPPEAVTAVLPTAGHTTQVTPAPQLPPASPGTEAGPSLIDRAGDAISQAAANGWRRALSLHREHKMLAAVALLLLVLLVAASVVGNNPAPRKTQDVPSGTPSDLRGPLRDLHAAVEGR